MKIEFNFGTRVSVLPASVIDKLESASKLDLRVLFALSLSDNSSMTPAALAEKLGASEGDVSRSVEFWSRAGVINVASDTEIPTKTTIETKAEKSVVVRRSDEIPSYTTEELTAILSKRKETSFFVDECQKELGKIFNTREINIVLGLIDYLGMEFEYVLTLLKYCRGIGKRSMSYAEKLAFGFVDEGIDTPDALKARIEELEAIAQNENAVRRLFGLKARALTAKEKKFLSNWFVKFGFNIDVVEYAYEKTVSSTGEASLAYANKILERWRDEGLKTLDDIRRSDDEYKAKKAQESKDQQSGSFDTDDFFEASLKRSLEYLNID